MRPEREARVGGLGVDALEEVEQRRERELHAENAEHSVHAAHLFALVVARAAPVDEQRQRGDHWPHRCEQRPVRGGRRRRAIFGRYDLHTRTPTDDTVLPVSSIPSHPISFQYSRAEQSTEVERRGAAHGHPSRRVQNAEIGGRDGAAEALLLVAHEAEEQRRPAGGALDHVLRELDRPLVVLLVGDTQLALLEEPARSPSKRLAGEQLARTHTLQYALVYFVSLSVCVCMCEAIGDEMR